MNPDTATSTDTNIATDASVSNSSVERVLFCNHPLFRKMTRPTMKLVNTQTGSKHGNPSKQSTAGPASASSRRAQYFTTEEAKKLQIKMEEQLLQRKLPHQFTELMLQRELEIEALNELSASTTTSTATTATAQEPCATEENVPEPETEEASSVVSDATYLTEVDSIPAFPNYNNAVEFATDIFMQHAYHSLQHMETEFASALKNNSMQVCSDMPANDTPAVPWGTCSVQEEYEAKKASYLNEKVNSIVQTTVKEAFENKHSELTLDAVFATVSSSIKAQMKAVSDYIDCHANKLNMAFIKLKSLPIGEHNWTRLVLVHYENANMVPILHFTPEMRDAFFEKQKEANSLDDTYFVDSFEFTNVFVPKQWAHRYAHTANSPFYKEYGQTVDPQSATKYSTNVIATVIAYIHSTLGEYFNWNFNATTPTRGETLCVFQKTFGSGGSGSTSTNLLTAFETTTGQQSSNKYNPALTSTSTSITSNADASNMLKKMEIDKSRFGMTQSVSKSPFEWVGSAPPLETTMPLYLHHSCKHPLDWTPMPSSFKLEQLDNNLMGWTSKVFPSVNVNSDDENKYIFEHAKELQLYASMKWKDCSTTNADINTATATDTDTSAAVPTCTQTEMFPIEVLYATYKFTQQMDVAIGSTTNSVAGMFSGTQPRKFVYDFYTFKRDQDNVDEMHAEIARVATPPITTVETDTTDTTKTAPSITSFVPATFLSSRESACEASEYVPMLSSANKSTTTNQKLTTHEEYPRHECVAYNVVYHWKQQRVEVVENMEAEDMQLLSQPWLGSMLLFTVLVPTTMSFADLKKTVRTTIAMMEMEQSSSNTSTYVFRQFDLTAQCLNTLHAQQTYAMNLKMNEANRARQQKMKELEMIHTMYVVDENGSKTKVSCSDTKNTSSTLQVNNGLYVIPARYKNVIDTNCPTPATDELFNTNYSTYGSEPSLVTDETAMLEYKEKKNDTEQVPFRAPFDITRRLRQMKDDASELDLETECYYFQTVSSYMQQHYMLDTNPKHRMLVSALHDDIITNCCNSVTSLNAKQLGKLLPMFMRWFGLEKKRFRDGQNYFGITPLHKKNRKGVQGQYHNLMYSPNVYNPSV